MCFDLKEAIGVQRIQAVEHHYVRRAINAWKDDPRIRILGDLVVKNNDLSVFKGEADAIYKKLEDSIPGKIDK